MRARYLLFSVCVASFIAVACGDDDQPSNGTGGKAGSSAAGSPGDAGATDVGGKTGTGGRPNTGGTTGGTTPLEGGAGGAAGGEAPNDGFTAFVHDLVKNQTKETNAPASVNDKKFPDPQDDHGHYLVPATDFDDLF